MQKRAERLQELKGHGVCCKVVSSICDREDALMKSQQYEHLNMTYTMTTSVGIQALIPYEDPLQIKSYRQLIAAKRGRREKQPSSGRSPLTVI